jgi:hypothetical protein
VPEGLFFIRGEITGIEGGDGMWGHKEEVKAEGRRKK